MTALMRNMCPSHVPLPHGVEGQDNYGDMEGVEVSVVEILRRG